MSGILHNELSAFFVDHVEAFLRNNADALSELWEPVGLFPSPNGNFAMDRRTFREHCVTPSFDAAAAKVRNDPAWRYHELRCGHDAMIEMPDDVTQLLNDAAA
jgi:hypothetical protein